MTYTIDRILGKYDLKPSGVSANTMQAVQSVRGIDDRTVEVKLSIPSASFLPALGVINNMIYPAHKPGPYRDAFPFLGSGPFQLQSVTPDIKNVLVRNDKYWKKDEFGAQLPYLDRIEIFIITDITAARAGFDTGQLDVTLQTAFPYQGRIKELQKRFPDVGIDSWWSNRGIIFRNEPPTNDRRLRYAVQLALDREAATQVWFPGESRAPVLYGLLSSRASSKWTLTEADIKNLPGYNPATKQQDIAEANRLLGEFLKDNGQTKESFILTTLTFTNYEPFFLIAQDQLKKNLGLQNKVEVVDVATLGRRRVEGSFQALGLGVSFNWDDPSELAPYFQSGSGGNDGRWSNPELDGLFKQIDAELDPAKRKVLTNNTEKKLFDLAYAVTVIGDPGGYTYRGYVKNISRFAQTDNYSGQYERAWLDK